MNASDSSTELLKAVGQEINRLRRILYLLPDGTTSQEGSIEIMFPNGAVLLLDSGPDGETLRVETHLWTDPFAEPLSDQNRSFVDTAGKWSAFGVSNDALYSRLIGQKVQSVKIIATPAGKLTGCLFQTSVGSLGVQVVADELVVTVSPNAGVR
jgi:hypothetical protein